MKVESGNGNNVNVGISVSFCKYFIFDTWKFIEYMHVGFFNPR